MAAFKITLNLAVAVIAVLNIAGYAHSENKVGEISDCPWKSLMQQVKEIKEANDQLKKQVAALISGKTHYVQASGLTASSSYDSKHGPQCSRLGIPKPPIESCGILAWHASTSDRNTWLQVDLGAVFEIQTIATQGRGLGDTWDQWTKTYQISFLQGSKLIYYVDRQSGGTKTFKGNSDRTTVVRHSFVPPIRAQVVRLHPVTWYNIGSTRWELYGKPIVG